MQGLARGLGDWVTEDQKAVLNDFERRLSERSQLIREGKHGPTTQVMSLLPEEKAVDLFKVTKRDACVACGSCCLGAVGCAAGFVAYVHMARPGLA